MCEMERVLWECEGFFCNISATNDDIVCCNTGSTSMLFCLSLTRTNETILNVWLCNLIIESAKLLQLHSSVSVAIGMLHRE